VGDQALPAAVLARPASRRFRHPAFTLGSSGFVAASGSEAGRALVRFVTLLRAPAVEPASL
jgi:hypothetical protein